VAEVPLLLAAIAVAEVFLLIAVIAVPLIIGAATAYFTQPWWWGALIAVAVFMVAAIA